MCPDCPEKTNEAFREVDVLRAVVNHCRHYRSHDEKKKSFYHLNTERYMSKETRQDWKQKIQWIYQRIKEVENMTISEKFQVGRKQETVKQIWLQVPRTTHCGEAWSCICTTVYLFPGHQCATKMKVVNSLYNSLHRWIQAFSMPLWITTHLKQNMAEVLGWVESLLVSSYNFSVLTTLILSQMYSLMQWPWTDAFFFPL